MKEELKVGPGMFVKYAYKLTDVETGKELFATPEGEPDEMVYGVSQEVVPGLIAAMDGLKKGDKFEVELPPEAAFGLRYPENEIELDKDIFMRDGKLAEEVKVGAELPMMTAEGYRVLGKVIEVGDKIKMDFNHPFAGKTVAYDGVIEEVREATPEELQSAQGGCGCGGCGGGSCGDHGCGDGCCH
ncbi:MAG: FKBP-type peptidyl-prolyl cis-trans isomerase [Muribaculaceae bacterium]|nr:FKBP-type peptidyl-prolyl cis-trans isomerase [Muribaculaceae bacterium]